MSRPRRIRWLLDDLAARLGPRAPATARTSAAAAGEVGGLDLAAMLHDPGIEAAWQTAERRIAARPLGELPWPTKQGTRRTSLAVLGRG